MPWRAGLTNQGGQATVPENALWEARNADMDPTGRLFKRPGFRRWNTKLVVQPKSGLTYTEAFSDLDNFTAASAGTAANTRATLEGNNLVMEGRAANDGTDKQSLIRAVQTSDGTVATNNQAIVTMIMRADTTMPAQSTTTTADNGFAIHIRTDHANICTLLWLSTGLFYYDGANFVLAGSETDIDDQKWHKVEIKLTAATTAEITIDDDTDNTVSITFATYADETIAANGVALTATTNDDAVYRASVNLLQYADGNTMNAAKIRAMKNWSSRNPRGQHLLVVAEDMIYEDKWHSGHWTCLDAAPSGDIILVPWISELLICGSNDVVRRWSGDDKPILAPPEVPSDVIAGTAHQGRFVCATSDRPLTVRYSGANDLSLWNHPDTGGESSFDIPDADGEAITAMRGDFYGLLIIWTNNSTWVYHTNGNPLYDGILKRVAENVGCVGPRAHTAIGKDVIFLSHDGVHTLSTIQEFGDVASASVTTSLRGLWQHNNNVDQRKIIPNRDSHIVHAAAEAKTYVSVQQSGQASLNSIFVFQHDLKAWTGPYTFDSTLTAANGGGMKALEYMQVGTMGRRFLFAASTLGDVAYMANDRKSDYPNSISGTGYPIQFYIRSARLDGRSVNPAFVRRMKRWRGMWLYILPRGGDSIKVSWNVDGEPTTESVTAGLNPYKEPLLDTTFSLGVSALGDPERIGVIWVPLDTRGRWLEFTLELDGDTSAEDKDIAIVGFEIDATVGDEEKE
jgi:hypothetical protein